MSYKEQEACFVLWHQRHSEIVQQCSTGQVREFLHFAFSSQAESSGPRETGRTPAAVHGRGEASASFLAMEVETPGSMPHALCKASAHVQPAAAGSGGDLECSPCSRKPKAKAKNQAKNTTPYVVSPTDCTHEHIKRSGNKHGSYAQCLQCLIKWKWNQASQGWEQFSVASSSSRLPLPSSATVLDHSWTGHRSGYPASSQEQLPLPPTGTTSKTSSPATSGPLPRGQRTIMETIIDYQKRHGAPAIPPSPIALSENSPDVEELLDRQLGAWEDSTGLRGSTASTGQRSSLSAPPGDAGTAGAQRPRIRLGIHRRLAGNLNRAANVLAFEAQIYDDMPAALDVPKIDVMELYAGHADLTFLAHQYGLQAMEPFDLLYGKDMTLRKDKQAWKSAQRTYKPLLAVFETECTDWNIFNENLNYKGKDRMDELYYKRELQYPWSKRASPHAISRSRTTATPGHTAAATAMVIPSEKSINGSPTPPRSPSPSPRR